jgi:hypothetical protein
VASDTILAAAALVFETRRDIHGGAEIVEHPRRRHARSGMKAELQHDGVAPPSRGVEACDIVLIATARTAIGTGECSHDRMPPS